MKYISDVCFAEVNGEKLMLDILSPTPNQNDKIPAVIYIHGGGWSSGTYKMFWDTADITNPNAYRMSLNYKLVINNFVAVSIEYRFSDKAIFPAQIEDCKAAIKWLKAHADDYNIDTNHIGVWGHSAGAHLAALLGTAVGVKELECESNSNKNISEVQATVDLCAPTDCSRINRWFDDENSPAALLIGGKINDNLDKVQSANPISYVNSKSTPFMIIHGEKDDIIPIEQSEILYDSLKANDVEVEFIRVKNANHSFDGVDIQPDWDYIEMKIIDFFNKHLR